MKGKGLLIGLWTTLRHIWQPAVTVQYPVHKREIPQRYRGRHGMRTDADGDTLCIGCKQCERICPDRLITVTTEKAPEGSKKKLNIVEFTVDAGLCMYCALCEDVCPTDAIVLTQFYEMATTDKSTIFLNQQKLIESGKLYREPEEWKEEKK